MPTFDPLRSDHRSDDRPASFVGWMMGNKFHHCLSETDPDSADAAAVLVSLLDVIVADAARGSAEQLVDSPI